MIPLLDLTPQYESIREELDAAVAAVVSSQRFILGPEVESFEAEFAAYVDAPHAVGVASGTDALLLPLLALDPRPGDEVIVPAFTFFATAGAVWNAGFRPVFCDVDPRTFNVTAETLEAVRTPRTRAAIAVHLFGQMAPMEELLRWGDQHDVTVIEDAAQSVGASRTRSGMTVMAGAAAPVSAFSFFPTKNLGAFGDAGMVTARDGELADRVAKLRVHGGRQMYHHEMVGTNSRLDALQAAVLRVKLRYLDEWTEARRSNAARYDSAFVEVAEVLPPAVLEGNRHVYNQYTVRCRRRNELREAMSAQGVGSGVYYPVPLHLQDCFSELGGRVGQFPVSEQLCAEVLSLPIFPELGADRLDRVADTVQGFFGT